MKNIYEVTSLTPVRAAQLSGYIDWASQPALFKHYPHFLFRYGYDTIEALKIAELSRCITSSIKIGDHPYYRLNTPSAGNLHPIELYVQIRGIKGVISGIYHIDAKEKSLVLVREIEKEGIEPFVGFSNRFKGMIFIVSIVPFRSEWKYGERAVRYCYLDAGHQMGAILASAEILGQKTTILSDIDALSLNDIMGFGRHEFSCMAVGVGEETDKSVVALQDPLMEVAPTDYCEGQSAFSKYLEHYKYTVTYPSMHSFSKKMATVYERRSVRLFEDKVIANEIADFVLQRVEQLPSYIDADIVILKNGSKSPGLYRKGKEVKYADYAERVSHLMVDQSFLKNAAMILIFTAKEYSAKNLMTVGAFAHMLQLETTERGIGFTGIGAFYDKKLQAFLENENHILYVCALGESRS